MKDHHQPAAGLDPRSYFAGAIEVFCELTAAGLKELALSAPFEEPLLSQIRPLAQKSAEKYGLVLHEEQDFPQTRITPPESIRGKTIFLFCRNQKTLTAYLDLKARAAAGNEETQTLRHLLGYSPHSS